MKFTAVFSFDEKAKFKTIDNTFEKYGLELAEVANPDGRGLNYAGSTESIDMLKYVGYARKNKISGDNAASAIAAAEVKDLNSMRVIMAKPNYDKAVDKLNSKVAALRQKERQAQKAANDAGNASSMQMNNAMTFCNDIANKIDSFVDASANDPKVVAAKQKTDKFMQKNKIMFDSQNYTLGGGNQDMTYTPQIMVNMQSSEQKKSTNIDTVITESKKTLEKELNSYLAKFKEMAKSILNGTSHFDFMLITDNNVGATPSSQRNIIVDKLTLEDIVNLGPREKLSIFMK